MATVVFIGGGYVSAADEISNIGKANYYDVVDRLAKQGKYTATFTRSNGETNLMVGDVPWVVGREQPNNVKYYYYNQSEKLWGEGGSVYASSAIITTSSTIYHASHDIKRADGTIFFSAPVRPIAEIVEVGLQEVPKTMKAQMVDGGILSVALIVLGSLLVVGLVVRLVRLFSR